MIPFFARRACHFTRLLSTATVNATWSEEAIQPFSKFIGKSIRKGESIDLSQQQLEDLISTEDENLAQAYILHANSVTEVHFSNKVSLHGFMDLHNMCERNCQHCWMRRANKEAKRFMCFPTHVYDNMEWLYNNGIGTIVICSGEFNNEGRTEFIENIIHNTIDKSKIIDKGLREKKGDFSGGAAIQIGLQMGEIPLNTGKRYFKNGANLFYLRMEAMDRLLFKDVFIREKGYDERIENIKRMMNMGYEVYSGTIVGLPFQTDENLVEDILGMKELGVDGLDFDVYMPTKDTPIYPFWREQNDNQYRLYLERSYQKLKRMIALSRILMPLVSITSSELHLLLRSNGMQEILNAGANVVKMFSGPQWTRQFNLYFDEMQPAFPEDEVLQHNLQVIQEAGKIPVLSRAVMNSPAYIRRISSSFWCV